MTIEERLRNAAAELRAEPTSPLPPLEPHRAVTRHAALWGITVLLVVGGVWTISVGRDDRDTSATVPSISPTTLPQPVPVTTTTAPSTSETAPTTTAVVPSTTVAEVTARWLDVPELEAWMGTWSMQPQTVTADLGSTGFFTYRLETTPTSFCIRTGGGGSCSSVADASTPFDPPLNFGSGGGSEDYAADRWNQHVFVPLEVEVRALHDGTPACDMQRFTLEPYAPIALWACEGAGAPPDNVDYEFTRGADVVMFAGPGELPEVPLD